MTAIQGIVAKVWKLCDVLRDDGITYHQYVNELTYLLFLKMASRSLAPWLAELIRTGYEFHLVFLWLPSAELALERVADRVRMGGHHVPEATVRRRYDRGLRNFFRLYQPLATSWRMYDNSAMEAVRLIAAGIGTDTRRVSDQTVWNRITKEFGHGE